MHDATSSTASPPPTTHAVRASGLHKYRCNKSALLTAGWVLMGLTSIINTTLPTFLHNLDVNIEQLSRGLSMQGLGGIIGSVVAGYYGEAAGLSHDYCFGMILCCYGASFFLKAVVSKLLLFQVLIGLEGIAAGAMNVFGCRMTVELWGDQVGVPMHLLHLGYGIGITVAPYVALVFMSNTSHQGSIADALIVDAGPLANHDTHADSFTLPFGVITLLFMGLGVVFMHYYSKHTVTVPVVEIPVPHLSPVKAKKQHKHDAVSTASNKRWYIYTITAMFALFYSLHVAQQLSVTRFLYVYVVKKIQLFTPTEGAHLMIINGLFFTLGRATMTLVAHKVRIELLVFLELIVSMICSMFLAFGSVASKENIWINSCLINFMSGPLWPGGYTWASNLLMLYTQIIAVIELGNQSGSLIFQWIAGYYLEYGDARSIMCFTALMSVLIVVLSAAILVIAALYGRWDKGGYKKIKDELRSLD